MSADVSNWFQDHIEKFSFKGPALIFPGAPRQRYAVPPLDFSRSGNDAKGLLTPLHPRPLQGVYGGPVANLVEQTDETYEPVKVEGGVSKVPARYRKVTEVSKVTCDLPFSNDWSIKKYVRSNGPDLGAYFFYGGSFEPLHDSLLILRIRSLEKAQRVYEAHWYELGAYKPSQETTSERGFTVYKFEYLPVCARREDGCPALPGQQTVVGWFFRLRADGTNMLVHPAFPEVEIESPSFLPYFSIV